ncbi:MAG: hypothetical protein ACYC2E_07115, partial [Sulfuricella sp.]
TIRNRPNPSKISLQGGQAKCGLMRVGGFARGSSLTPLFFVILGVSCKQRVDGASSTIELFLIVGTIK